MQAPLLQSALDRWPVHRGKVRDIYDLGDRLLLVATDRISAFDWVLPTGIPDKGRVLTQTSLFWLEQLDVPDHLLSAEVEDFGLPADVDPEQFAGRSMLSAKPRWCRSNASCADIFPARDGKSTRSRTRFAA